MTTVFSVDGFGQTPEQRSAVVGRLSISQSTAQTALQQFRLARATVMIDATEADSIEAELEAIIRSHEAALVQARTATAMELAALDLEAGRLASQTDRAATRARAVVAAAHGEGAPPSESGFVKSAAVPVALAVGVGVLGLLFIASRP